MANDIENEDKTSTNEEISFEELEQKLNEDLTEQLSDLDFLEEQKENIQNPNKLGDAVLNVVWEQFQNQIGVQAGEDFIADNNNLKLDLRNSAHIQTADNFKNGKIATHNYISRESLEQNYDRYKNVPHKKFRKEYVNPGMDKTLKRAGELNKEGVETVTDIYTGRQIPTAKKLENGQDNPQAAQREHVKPSAELYDDPSLQMANGNQELADIINDPENLQGYTTAERNGRKSDKTSDEMEDIDKNKHWEKANEKAEKFINKKKKEGEDRLKKEGRKTQIAEAKRIGKNVLRTMILQMLTTLLKEIIGKLVNWLKQKQKTLQTLLEALKEAIMNFVHNLKNTLKQVGDGAVTTIATAIVGPVVATVKKIWIFLKQGWKSLKNAINYLKNPENKNKPFSIVVLEVGKIIMAGLAAGGAIALGEVIEKGLLAAAPFFAFQIPLLGSLANIIGIFLGGVVAGIIGALALNLIDKLIAKKQLAEINEKKVEKGNQIIVTQEELKNVKAQHFDHIKKSAAVNISKNHEDAKNYISEAVKEIFNEDTETDNSDIFESMQKKLKNMED